MSRYRQRPGKVVSPKAEKVRMLTNLLKKRRFSCGHTAFSIGGICPKCKGEGRGRGIEIRSKK